MISNYKSIMVMKMSVIFKGFQDQREFFVSHIPWDGSDCDRALIAPERFLEFFDKLVSTEIDISNIGPWNIIRPIIEQVVKDDERKNGGGLQQDYYIDIEN